jgi:anoctamin-10
VRDWIHGVRASAPPKETREALESEPLYEAERLRIIYQLITNPTDEGGAGITPKDGEWEGVESIFALHDHAYNKDWIKKWTSSYFLKTEDLDDIRNRLGEKVWQRSCCVKPSADHSRSPSTLLSPSRTLPSSCSQLPLVSSRG